MIARVYSQQFDDIYFSPEDGLAETRHTFLAGNGLPEAWAGRESFVIAETGFGTGLNFLAAWKLFDETAGPAASLDYISFEKYPLSAAAISGALAHWSGEFGGRLEKLASRYPLRVPGFHRIVFSPRIRLTLVFDDVNDAIRELDTPVDAWFLDGFAPAKNPQMWSETVFREMARLSAPQATFATFTAAGAVRRGLQAAGFTAEKRPGYGRKKEHLAGRFAGDAARPPRHAPAGRIAVLGGGLAGTACAWALKQYGANVTLFEKAPALATQASGNWRGLYNPRFSALRTAESDFYAGAYAGLLRTLPQLADTGWNRCGSLHLLTDTDRARKLSRTARHWSWHEDHMKLLSAEEASAVAGIEIPHEALWLPESGYVSPPALCRAYADSVDVRYGAGLLPLRADSGWRVGDETFEACVLACGAGIAAVPDLSWLPVYPVRGQLSRLAPSAISRSLKTNLCYDGSITPIGAEGFHVGGSTFQRYRSDTQPLPEDEREILGRMVATLPSLGMEPSPILESRAAIRISSRDHFPVAGAIPDRQDLETDMPGLYISAAHGSHGLVSSWAAGQLIANLICSPARACSRQVAAALSPARFLRREARTAGRKTG